jgi:hypothetical protein
MALSLAEQLRRSFDLATLKRQARTLKTARHWQQANHLMLRCDALRTKELRLYRERYDTRVEVECRRLLHDSASARRELKPNWIGQDRFNAADLLRQARRNVLAHHENRLGRLDALETRELRRIVWKAARENQIEGTAQDAFTRAVDRRMGMDRRQQRGRS